MTTRYQIGRGWQRGGLRTNARTTQLALRKAIGDVLTGDVSWRVKGGDEWNRATGPHHAAEQMMAQAKASRSPLEIVTRDKAKLGPSLHVYTQNPPNPGDIPRAAKLLPSVRRTLRFHEEIHLAVPKARPLGLYVPRPLRDDTPAGWDVGDPWPRGAYASEHAWASADDCGGDNAKANGYEPAGPKLSAILAEVTLYTRSNFARLGVVQHIYEGRQYIRRPDRTPLGVGYGGDDRHETHTHTSFADHDGRKPTWLR